MTLQVKPTLLLPPKKIEKITLAVAPFSFLEGVHPQTTTPKKDMCDMGYTTAGVADRRSGPVGQPTLGLVKPFTFWNMIVLRLMGWWCVFVQRFG